MQAICKLFSYINLLKGGTKSGIDYTDVRILFINSAVSFLDFSIKWEYVLSVVVIFEWPTRALIDDTSSLLLSNKLTDVCLKLWNGICSKLYLI